MTYGYLIDEFECNWNYLNDDNKTQIILSQFKNVFNFYDLKWEIKLNSSLTKTIECVKIKDGKIIDTIFISKYFI